MERQKLGIICGVKGLFRGPRSRFAICFFLFAISLPLYSQTQTELGSEGDLTVLGTGGTALDPNTEIKGFTVFGSTQAAYTGAVIGNGNVVVNGVLAVSSGAYFVGNSTFPAAAKIFINDGSPGQILSKNSGGWLEWFNAGAIGDNLGTHIATQTLNLAGWNMVNASSVNFRSNVFISSASEAQHGGIYVSSNVYIVGFSSAAKYYGDGSSLTGIAAAVPASINISTINATATTPYGGVNITTNTFVQGKVTITGGASRLSNTVGDISIEPAGGNLNVTKNVTVAGGQNIGFEGAAGDSYMKYNGGYVSVYADGVEVARFKP